MSRGLRIVVAGCTIVLVCLGAVSAAAQERLFLLRGNGMLIEVDTAEESLGTVRRVAQLPSGTWVVPLAGGRYLALQYAPYDAPMQVGLFDTRSFRVVSSLTLPAGTGIHSDRFRPRLFYRRGPELGVIESHGARGA